MIAKYIPIRKTRNSHCGFLIDYLVNKKNNEKRVDRIIVSNCDGEDIISAKAEMEYVQDRNTRAQSNKTYHLVLSFGAGERPHDYVLDDIEREVCNALGFSDHQRVSVAHNDTDHFHVHLAINKVHPKKNTLHEPYKAFYKLSKVCELLEERHGLQMTNHLTIRPGEQSNSIKVDHYSQMQSLQSWIKSNVFPVLQTCDNWDSFHSTLKSFGLEIVPIANGFVFKTLNLNSIETIEGKRDNQVFAVKASSIDRCLGKQQLIKRFGEFQKPVTNMTVSIIKKTYANDSHESKISPLYQKYLNEKKTLLVDKRGKYKELKEWKLKQFEKEFKHFDAKRRFIKNAFRYMRPLMRKIMIEQAYMNYQRSLFRLKQEHDKRRIQILDSYNQSSWKEWKQKNQLGDVANQFSKKRGDVKDSRKGHSIQ